MACHILSIDLMNLSGDSAMLPAPVVLDGEGLSALANNCRSARVSLLEYLQRVHLSRGYKG